MRDTDLISLNMRVLRWAMVFWLAGWFVRTGYFLKYFFVYIARYPVHFTFFPEFFQSPDVSIIVYFLPTLAIPAVLRPDKARMIASTLLFIICSLISLWHIDTYNDATYVTCFWVAVWMAWLAFNLDRNDDGFRWQACFIAQLIVGGIFIGGAIGKMTPEYLSGQVWVNMFLKYDHYWLGYWINHHLPQEQVLLFSRVISRGMICAESLIGLLPFIPFRYGAIGSSVLMVIMLPMTNSLLVFSVLGCLIGMLTGCLFLEKGIKNKV